jgi:molybdopterin synthase catalytic subunit
MPWISSTGATTDAAYAEAMPVARTTLSAEPLDVAALTEAVAGPDRGAVITFCGNVRDHDADRPVTRLEYEAHPDAAAALRRIAGAVAERHPECILATAHRHGEVPIGDAAFVAVAASAHRGEAFAAVVDLVDSVKAELPIWKRQTFADGQHEWVGSA